MYMTDQDKDQSFGTLSGVSISGVSAGKKRLSMLIWGEPGTGKTTYAATAPGKKLIINWDPDGPTSVATRDDVFVADMVTQRPNIVMRGRNADPFGLRNVLSENPDIETVIFDSLTSFSQKTLEYATTGAGLTNASPEKPSLESFGYRLAVVSATVRNLLSLTFDLNRHIIFIAHESPIHVRDVADHFGLSLGGKMNHEIPLQLSEVWNVRADAGKYTFHVTQTKLRKPMKTRMFTTTGTSGSFVSRYKPEDTDDSNGIAGLYDQWRNNNYAKISLPK